MTKISKIKVSDDLKRAVLKSVDLIGGFRSFIKTGDIVLLKPNFNTADPFPASSDLGFLKAMVELAYEFGSKSVIVGESSMFTLNTRKTMEKTGVFSLAELKPSAEIFSFDEHKWIKKKIANGKYLKSISVPEILDKVDKLILLPCLKTHIYARYTGALKLSVGFMKQRERICLHLGHLQEKIAELNAVINPDLIVMDARKCFITGGPAGGIVREPNLILASADRIAIDVEGIKIIQSFEGNELRKANPWELTQIKWAIQCGIGVRSEKDYLFFS